MTKEQWTLAAVMVGAVGSLSVANADAWAELWTPRVILPAFTAIATQLRSIYTEKP